MLMEQGLLTVRNFPEALHELKKTKNNIYIYIYHVKNITCRTQKEDEW